MKLLTGLVKIANVWAGTIGVDLVDGDCDGGSCLDLGDSSGSNHIFGVLSDIDVTSQLSTSTLVDDVGADFCLSDDGAVLLARVDGRAIPGKGQVNLETNTLRRTSNTLSSDNGTVSRDG